MPGERGKAALLDLIENGDWGEFSPLMDGLKKSAYWVLFCGALEGLKREALYKSHVHGEGHIERVMLHGAVSAMDHSISEEDARLLINMCAYHDTGRISDLIDYGHGYRSAHKLGELSGQTGEELKMMMAGVEAHSRPDADMDSVIEGYDPLDYGRTRNLAEMLKDADGLDRVRICDLDPSFLRFDSSRVRASFAQYLYGMYAGKKGVCDSGNERQERGYNRELVMRIWKRISDLPYARDCPSASAMLDALLDLTDAKIENDVCRPYIGMRGEVKSRMQCGLVEGALMFMSIYFSQAGLQCDEISKICSRYGEIFTKRYSSLLCRELRPGGFSESDPPDLCAGLTLDAILFSYEYITEIKKRL